MKQIQWNQIKEKIDGQVWAKQLYEDLKKDTLSFIRSYHDDPQNVAGWGHHYHCLDCGGGLIFDHQSPHQHTCRVCDKINQGNQDQDNAWTFSYRSNTFKYIYYAGLLYQIQPKKEYIDFIEKVYDFFADHYDEFKAQAPAKRFEGRLTGINLTDAGGAINGIMGMELVKEQLCKNKMKHWEKHLFIPLADMFDQFSNKIYNIPVYMKVAEGIIGVFFQNQSLMDRAFYARFGILDQLKRGVTKDGMWYECSTHYHFYTLDPLLQLLVICKNQNIKMKDLDLIEDKVYDLLMYPLKNMFRNGYFPNPCDGWPDMRIDKYVKQYEYGSFLFDEPAFQKACSFAYKSTKPGIEKLLFNDGYTDDQLPSFGSQNFEDSYNALLKNDVTEVYIKTGIKTICHAHPDVMTIEMAFFNDLVSYDLGSNGYSTKIFNEWQRKTIAHNTVTLNQMDQKYEPDGEGIWPEGIVEHFDDHRIRAKSKNVYECVDYIRDIQLNENQIHDQFEIIGVDDSYIMDWAFYCEGEILCDHHTEKMESIHDQEGYQHLKEIRRFDGSKDWSVLFDMKDKTLKVGMKGHPNTQVYLVKSYTKTFKDTRSGIIVRRNEKSTIYDTTYVCDKKGE